MSPFARFVSHKLTATITAFAVVAAGLVVFVAVRDAGSGSTGVTSADLAGAHALDAALSDPASAVDQGSGATDPSGGLQQLRADLKAARALQGDARRQALAAIRTKARDGAYGDKVQRRAERRQIRHDLFLSLLPDNLQSDLARLKDAPADQRKQLRADILAKAVAGDYGADVQKAAVQLQKLRKA